MKQVGEGEVSISGNSEKDLATNWSEEYISSSANHEQLSKDWVDEHVKTETLGNAINPLLYIHLIAKTAFTQMKIIILITGTSCRTNGSKCRKAKPNILG